MAQLTSERIDPPQYREINLIGDAKQELTVEVPVLAAVFANSNRMWYKITAFSMMHNIYNVPADNNQVTISIYRQYQGTANNLGFEYIKGVYRTVALTPRSYTATEFAEALQTGLNAAANVEIPLNPNHPFNAADFNGLTFVVQFDEALTKYNITVSGPVLVPGAPLTSISPIQSQIYLKENGPYNNVAQALVNMNAPSSNWLPLRMMGYKATQFQTTFFNSGVPMVSAQLSDFFPIKYVSIKYNRGLPTFDNGNVPVSSGFTRQTTEQLRLPFNVAYGDYFEFRDNTSKAKECQIKHNFTVSLNLMTIYEDGLELHLPTDSYWLMTIAVANYEF